MPTPLVNRSSPPTTTTSRHGTSAGAALIVAVLILNWCVGCSKYKVASYWGDGRLRDDVDQVSYQLELPPIRAGFIGQKRFRIGYLPETEMQVFFEPVSPSSSAYSLTDRTRIHISIVQIGKTVPLWDADGPITNWRSDRSEFAFRWSNVAEVAFERHEIYFVTVAVSGEPIPFDWQLKLTRFHVVGWP